MYTKIEHLNWKLKKHSLKSIVMYSRELHKYESTNKN